MIQERENQLKTFTNTKYRKGQWERFNKFIEGVILNKESDNIRYMKVKDMNIIDCIPNPGEFKRVGRTKSGYDSYKHYTKNLYLHGPTFTSYSKDGEVTHLTSKGLSKYNMGESGSLFDYFFIYENMNSIKQVVDYILGDEYGKKNDLTDIERRMQEEKMLLMKKQEEENRKKKDLFSDENLFNNYPEDYRNKNIKEAFETIKTKDESNERNIMNDTLFNRKKIINYLCEVRGLSKNIVEALIDDKRIQLDSNNNIVFNWIYNNKVIGADKRGSYKGSKYKGIESSSASDFGFTIMHKNCKKTKKIKKMFVFESAIDLLSFIDINKSNKVIEDALFISVAGLKTRTFFNYFDMIKNKGLEEIYICTDNESSSELFDNKIKNIFKDKTKYKLNYLKPKNKDWNDDLLELKNNTR